MGLIMLILIGAAPTAYALNRTMPDSRTPGLRGRGARPPRACSPPMPAPARPCTIDAAARSTVGEALRVKKVNTPQVFDALGVLSGDIVPQVKAYGSIKRVPAAATPNLRNDMYLVSDAPRR